MTPTWTELLLQATQTLQAKIPASFRPRIAIVLGSGLSDLTKTFTIQKIIPYQDIPGMIPTGVAGHKGELLLAQLGTQNVLIFSGRLHFYEGYPMEQIIFPIRLSARVGIQTMILTAAVGAANPRFKPGDLVFVSDHINFMGINPLRGIDPAPFGERFVDLSHCYTPALIKLALKTARRNKIRAHPGVYTALSGPSYETPAEIRAFRKLGADIVGMSMVTESIPACQMKLQVLGLCYAANSAAGLSKHGISHAEVIAAGKTSVKQMSLFLKHFLPQLKINPLKSREKGRGALA